MRRNALLVKSQTGKCHVGGVGGTPGVVSVDVADPQAPKYQVFADFLPIKTSSKISRLQNLPKIEKIRPSNAKVRFLMDVGSILGAVFDEMFKLFRKTPKARFY